MISRRDAVLFTLRQRNLLFFSLIEILICSHFHFHNPITYATYRLMSIGKQGCSLFILFAQLQYLRVLFHFFVTIFCYTYLNSTINKIEYFIHRI